jgi:phosphoglycerate dehydrogenase-like enzyme
VSENASVPLNILFLYDAPGPLRAQLADRLGAVVELHYAAADHPLDDPALLAVAAEADVLVGWKPTAEFLAHCAKARLFQLPWAGVTPLIDVFKEANELRADAGIPLLSLANNHGVATATAQHTVAMLLALTNQLVPHHGWLQAGQWRKGDSSARTVLLREDVTVGLLGYGAINQRVHQLLTPFGVHAIALRRGWPVGTGVSLSAVGTPVRASARQGIDDSAVSLTADPTADDLTAVPTGQYTAASLHDFLRATDILVIAVPHTAETEGLIGQRELALLGTGKPASRPATADRPLGGLPLLINVARGAVVDEAALYAALASGQLAGAALDVWYDYSPPADRDGRKFPWRNPVAHPFHELSNVLLSPHRAASPLDDLERWEPIIDNLLRLARGKVPHSVVDLEAGY